MRTEQHSEENTASGITASASWRLSQVKPLANYCLEIEFKDGTHGYVDLSQLIHGPKAGVFAALKDQKLFAKVFLEYGAVTWPGGIDLAPDAMYEEVKQRGGWILK